MLYKDLNISNSYIIFEKKKFIMIFLIQTGLAYIRLYPKRIYNKISRAIKAKTAPPKNKDMHHFESFLFKLYTLLLYTSAFNRLK
jgi:hypothetical protein